MNIKMKHLWKVDGGWWTKVSWHAPDKGIQVNEPQLVTLDTVNDIFDEPLTMSNVTWFQWSWYLYIYKSKVIDECLKTKCASGAYRFLNDKFIAGALHVSRGQRRQKFREVTSNADPKAQTIQQECLWISSTMFKERLWKCNAFVQFIHNGIYWLCAIIYHLQLDHI